jgi:acylphosphatase
MKCYRIIVSGKVQGVFFRDFTKQKAVRYKISGTVRNMKDGSVEIIAEADDEDMKKFIYDIKRGPEASRVKDVKILNNEKCDFKDFKILI